MSVSVAELVHRLAACPDDFLAAPRVGAAGTVSVAAVAGDTLHGLGAQLPAEWIASLEPPAADDHTANWLRCALVACWLAAHPALAGTLGGEQLLAFLAGDLHRLAGLVPATQLVSDVDRREELVRLLVRAGGAVPAGESAAHAADRLATLDSATRLRVEAEARAAEERAREVREALERKRAAEAAARASRE
jgi:hypothetical protein